MASTSSASLYTTPKAARASRGKELAKVANSNTTKNLTASGSNVPNIPTESQSRRLLEVVIFYIGETQHHFDIREFSDRLDLFYANPHDAAQQQTPWFLEMLLVLAIGKLFSGDFDDHNEIPGSELFSYAYKNLPTLGELYTHGVLGVEILALVAVYLQNLNRKDEAYLHISTALRLAISLGLHRRSGAKQFLHSQKVHVNRLWWTIYMQERRSAAATGNPFSIDDDAVELDMPTECVGYPTAGPLRTNCKVSKVLGSNYFW
ncbi:hypothetical protein N7509_009967 [Penicillium cosmopolitanum]|uniref:Xylanolytic transcriptional activator regulatory domain-containing protein n=1 Tax=Penicillium cosmopolitanum TaxID=1131564 RepID=A0A9X0B470_9EURO|nr:uncharacterized protein N7509_009967 [Penicillium cosmopolitanum]KAJ5387426.1 hypothetical protein N7509_009967 [Penicillium cosmopolitanum]